MQEKQQKKILTAFQLVLRPIVKIMLRYGIGYSDFAESAKTVFVDVGSSDFGIRGRPTNISRVAVMTGLTRKEVRRLRTKIESGEDTVTVKSTPITEILHRWHAEEDFLDAKGRPIRLPFNGEQRSFSELVRRFGGDVPPGAMRTELKRVGTIEEHEDGSLSVLSRAVMPADLTDNLITSLVHSAYPLLSTIAINTDPEGNGHGFAQFSAHSISVSEPDRKRLRRISYDRLAEAAVSFDDLLMAYESSGEKDDNPAIAVGLFYFEESDEGAKYRW